jgi:predicted secreted hydrolase
MAKWDVVQCGCQVPVALALALAAACAPAADPPATQTLQLGQLLGGTDTLHARAVAPRLFEFPADHGQHPDFRTEWWYFTGNLTAEDGRSLGYQLTFFRSALIDSAAFATARRGIGGSGTADTTSTADTTNSATTSTSAWRTRHAWMAHFAVSDAGTSRFFAAERFARGAAGLAGAQSAPFRVWLGAWAATHSQRGPIGRAAVDRPTQSIPTEIATMFPLTLRAAHDDVAIDLLLDAAKPLVLHGERGLSRKGAQPGNASYYYSFTRIETRGTVTIGGASHRVSGASWLDREWSTSVLADDVAGWDWLALQLTDSTELMLYRLRRDDGTADPFSAGTFVAADGSTTHLSSDAFTMTPLGTWSAASYPTSWRIDVPELDIHLDVAAAFDAQELVLAVRYWEGMVRATGTRRGEPVTARGYLEMTGYADTETAAAGGDASADLGGAPALDARRGRGTRTVP